MSNMILALHFIHFKLLTYWLKRKSTMLKYAKYGDYKILDSVL